jgi:Flp pilus assembly protein TadB
LELLQFSNPLAGTKQQEISFKIEKSMKGDRKFRREQKKKRKSEGSKITKKDKLYAFLIISGLFLAAIFIVLWLA